jgi:hypothetical protein
MEITNKEINDINEFKDSMIKILKTPKNEAKKSWHSLTSEELFTMLLAEVEELREALLLNENVLHECCDIANFAFMIYDKMNKTIQSKG